MDSTQDALKKLVDTFLARTAEEDPSLAKRLSPLDGEGRRNLGGVLGRFDRDGAHELKAEARLYARRVLGPIRKPTTEALVVMNKILDYLDININSLLEPSEMELAVEILEVFARADSVNDTLSQIELEMLYAVLRHEDRNNNKRLDPDELSRIRHGLADPSAYLARQKAENPLLQEVLARQR